MRKYKFDSAVFKETFKVSADSVEQLQHKTSTKIKIFPYTVNTTQQENYDFKKVEESYLQNYLKSTAKADPQKLFDSLQKKVKTDDIKLFDNVIKELYFTENEKGELELKPKNLEMIAAAKENEAKYKNIADYLSVGLGTKESVKDVIDQAVESQKNQYNVLEKSIVQAIADSSENKKSSTGNNLFHKVIYTFDKSFNDDLKFVLKTSEDVSTDVAELLELYYLSYTLQTAIQLNKFFSGDRNGIQKVYFCFSDEKTNQNRKCYTQGWCSYRHIIQRLFAHENTIKLLNCTPVEWPEQLDYLSLKEMIIGNEIDDDQTAEEINKICKIYCNHITDVENLYNSISFLNYNFKTESAIDHMFRCVEKQFNERRAEPRDKFAKGFERSSKYFLQVRGRSGEMLCINEETLLFLTRLCIKEKPKMWEQELFDNFEKRGISFDDQSRDAILQFYGKLNLIEKKSDGEGAQYVKRIL